MAEPSAGAGLESGPLLPQQEPDVAASAPAVSWRPLRWQVLTPLITGFLLVAAAVLSSGGSGSAASLPLHFAKQGTVSLASDVGKTLKCWVDSGSGSARQLVEVEHSVDMFKPKEPVCVFYKYKCVKDAIGMGCTPTDVKEGTAKGVHIFATADLCDYLKKVAYEPGSMKCCKTNLCNSGGSESNVGKALKCYVDGHGEMSVPALNGNEPVCLFYKYKCKKDEVNGGCTPAESKKEAVKGFHQYGTADMCDYIKQVSDEPASVQCCKTDLCNSNGWESDASKP